MSYLYVILAYLVILVVVGIFIGHRKVKNSDDFVVAGRSLPLVVLVGTLLASWCGGGGVTGSPNVIYTYGPFVGIIHFMGPPLGIIALYFVAGKVRQCAKYTIPEIFEARYGKVGSFVSAVCIILAYIGIAATQFKAAGQIINVTTGMDQGLATVIAAVGIIVLTVSGGMMTVAYTDAMSALLMVGGFLIAVPLLYNQIGGISHAFASLPAAKSSPTATLNVIQLLGYMIPSFFLILGDQNMMQRFSSAKSSKEAKKSNIGMFFGEMTVVTLTILVVTAGIFLIPQIPEGKTADTIIFQIAIGYLPFVVGGLLMAACVAFVITTADSYLLSSATNITYDIWAKYIKKDATDKEKLVFLRAMVVAVSVIGCALCMLFPSVLAVQMYSYSMYGAAITPALLCALFSKKVTPAGGICGILAGGITTIVWDVVLQSPYGIKSAIISVPVSVLAIIIVSAVTKGSKPIEDLYGQQES
ncbi:sodium:solute symporter family protein [Clostridium sp. AM58-1XD]|uniref:sodium:solute symporter family protein n=1 Tax=Clostridium sp. AM58-1XD TaxID=2292307 RepID=UPI000E51A85C|nr:sodium:solute symporter family protein [Clostridium sp. AM58-1XD]RGY98400.1 sodium:solute symporter family protein [Clostridium sp. AM58-1XD]